VKHGIKPTKKQSVRMKSLGLIPENWFISKCSTTEFVVVHRVSGLVRRLGA